MVLIDIQFIDIYRYSIYIIYQFMDVHLLFMATCNVK